MTSTASNKNDSIAQPRSTFSVDEFSEFQSAAPSTPANSTTRSTFGLTFDSPIHHSNPNKSSHSFVPLTSSAAATTTTATGNGFSKKDCIGSRLANYDLGTMSPRINQPQPNQSAQFFVPISSSNSTFQGSMLSTTNSTTNGDSLLIGEEDKYSALRGLIDEIPPPPPITQHQQEISPNSSHIPNSVSRVDGNVEHKISLVNDDVLEVVKTETMDKSLDFGDFQSFSSSEINTCTYPSAVTNKNNNHINNFSNARIQQNDLFDVNFAIINLNNNAKISSSSNEPWLTSEFKGLQIQPSTTTGGTTRLEQNASSLNDGDFGDFVSFSSSGKATVAESIVPASPKIVLKSELSKKSTSKSKKPSQSSVAKINLSRTLAKASNILIDSPTYPKSFVAEVNKSPLDDPQLSYYPTTNNTNHHNSNNNATMELSSSSSFDLMTSEGFDFGLSSPYTSNGGVGGPPSLQLDKIEFGAPLKTTLIGNSTSDDDDFGDFTTVHQVPIVDDSKVNNLDLLPFVTKSKLSCPQAAAETQSIASLDLGNYLESSDGKNFVDNEPSPDSSEALEFEPYMKEELNVINNRNPNDTMQTDLGFPHADEEDQSVSNSEDKYKCFKEEIESERERYSTEWSRCLTSCLQLLTYAQSTFNSVSSSEVIREIISNEKGYAYIQNLIEVYLVATRIHLSWKKLGGGDDIKKLFEEINAAWESLTPYFIGTPIMESVQDSVNKVNDWKEGDYSDCSKVCGVCLGSSMDQNPESLIDYGGKYYHAPCGNFYIHQVDSILPSLCYISML